MSGGQGPASVLVTGAEGYLGRLVVAELAAEPGSIGAIVATDIRPPARPLAGVTHLALDVRDPALGRALAEHRVDTVIHLAAVVTPAPGQDRDEAHSVEVRGTRSLLRAALAAGVRRLVYTSSGAAYGYHPDNPEWIDEDQPLRGNPEFAYSDHKRLVEEMLARWRTRHPEFRQLVFRPGAILGESTQNQITALFHKPVILGVAGSDSPFAFIWDQDVVGAIVAGVHRGAEGVYNLAGDGVVTMPEIARRLGKRYVAPPAWLLKAALWALQKAGLTQYGPEQVGFLQYRPVLSNRRLKEEFGYVPAKTSREVFEHYLAAQGLAAPEPEAETAPAPPPGPAPDAAPEPEQPPCPPEPEPGAAPEPGPRPQDGPAPGPGGGSVRDQLRRESRRFQRKHGRGGKG